MLTGRTTLTQFLIEERRRHPEASGDLNALILNCALACKAISRRVAAGALAGVTGSAAVRNVQGETQQKLDVIANDLFLQTNDWSGTVAGMVSEELADPYPLPERFPRGKYLLLFDPLDGSSNIDVNVAVGSIFSILRAPKPGTDAVAADFLQPGAQQVCAGYAIYGPATMLVITLGRGVHGFTLDPQIGEFLLTHPEIRIDPVTSEFAINASNERFWQPAVKFYVEECLAGSSGPRGRDFNMRWIASLVAETHRILMRGGVFLYPKDNKDPAKPGRLRLLYEANPISLIIEQAGGLATNGSERILGIQPTALHQRIGFVFGSAREVERIANYHRDHNERKSDAPLFGRRGLFRGTN
jgi:fructose-1,6-bisphosphatase I/sedoheptulose-1,7-bisphosphatase